jgi:hypothetical protein
MAANGKAGTHWGYAIEGRPSAMLQAALRSVCRNGSRPQVLPACDGQACGWVRRLAGCLEGTCDIAVVFCDDPGLACCVANKVPGVRAVAVWTVPQAHRALGVLGANLLAVEMNGRTYYECKELLCLCRDRTCVACPPGVACVLQELDGHAHR